jgi:adenylate cyclase
MKGFFDLLDEITKEIGTALQLELTWGDFARYIAATDNFEAWGYYNRAYSHFLRSSAEYKRGESIKARELLEKAVKLDPEYLPALRLIGWTHMVEALRGWSESPQQSIEAAIEVAKKAHAMESDAGAHALWSLIYNAKKQWAEAIEEGEEAIAKDPNFAPGHVALWIAMFNSGRFEEAIPVIKAAKRLHGPHFPIDHLRALAQSYCMAGHYEKAISTYKEYLGRSKAEDCLMLGHAGLAITYVWFGQEEKARNHIAEVLKLDHNYTIESYTRLLYFKNQADIDQVMDALRKAGLPE